MIYLTYTLYMLIIIFAPMLIERTLKIKNKSTRFLNIFLVCVILSFIAALRGNAGTDSAMYREAYENGTNSVFRWVDFEIGYLTLMDVLHFFRFPYQILFSVLSFFTCLFSILTIDIEKNLIDVRMASFLFISGLYFFSFNGMRQALAISIAIYAMTLFYNGKKINGIILIGVSLLFHYSALICFGAIICKYLFENRHSKIFMTIVFFTLLFVVFNRSFFGSIIKFITHSDYYVGYVTRQENVDSNIMNYIIKNMVVFIITILNFKKYKLNSRYLSYFGIMICGYIFSSLSSVTETQVGRLGYYFTNLNILVISYCCKYNLTLWGNKILKKENVKIILYIYLIFTFVYNYFIKNFSQLVPYGVI